MWKEFPAWLVHFIQSMAILSLKSSGSRIVAGRLHFGRLVISQKEHRMSGTACTQSLRNPCWRRRCMSLSAVGCPRLRWILRIMLRSSDGRARNLAPCFTLPSSVWLGDGVSNTVESGIWDWDSPWIGASVGTCWLTLAGLRANAVYWAYMDDSTY